MNKTNLIPTTRRRARTKRERIVRWVGIGVVYTLLLVIASFVAYFAWGTSSVDAGEISRVKNKISHANTAKALLHAQSRDAQRAMQSIDEISRQPDWSILLAAVAQRCGDDVFLSGSEMVGPKSMDQTPTIGGAPAAGGSAPGTNAATSPRGVILHLGGYGRSQEAISAFVLRLQELSVFERVKLLQTSRQGFAGVDAYSFQLDCAIHTGTGGAREH